MGSLLRRSFSEHDHRSVLIYTLLCDRRGCVKVEAVAVPTDEDRSVGHRAGDVPADFADAQAIVRIRGWQDGRPVRCPDHVTPSWRRAAGAAPAASPDGVSASRL